MKPIKKETLLIIFSIAFVFLAFISSLAAFVAAVSAIIFMIARMKGGVKKANAFWIVLVVLLIAAAMIINIRFLSEEDGWICDKGEWVRHGNPTEGMPSGGCNK